MIDLTDRGAPQRIQEVEDEILCHERDLPFKKYFSKPEAQLRSLDDAVAATRDSSEDQSLFFFVVALL